MQPSAKKARMNEQEEAKLKCQSCPMKGTEHNMFTCVFCYKDEEDINNVAICGRCTILHHINKGHEHRPLFPYFRDVRFAAMSKEIEMENKHSDEMMETLKKCEAETEALIARLKEISEKIMEVAKNMKSTAECEHYMALSRKLLQTMRDEETEWEKRLEERMKYYENLVKEGKKMLDEAKKPQLKSDV